MIFFIDNRFGMESRTALLENPNIQFVNTFWPIAVGGDPKNDRLMYRLMQGLEEKEQRRGQDVGR